MPSDTDLLDGTKAISSDHRQQFLLIFTMTCFDNHLPPSVVHIHAWSIYFDALLPVLWSQLLSRTDVDIHCFFLEPMIIYCFLRNYELLVIRSTKYKKTINQVPLFVQLCATAKILLVIAMIGTVIGMIID